MDLNDPRRSEGRHFWAVGELRIQFEALRDRLQHSFHGTRASSQPVSDLISAHPPYVWPDRSCSGPLPKNILNALLHYFVLLLTGTGATSGTLPTMACTFPYCYCYHTQFPPSHLQTSLLTAHHLLFYIAILPTSLHE
jgi:hypothetical protein